MSTPPEKKRFLFLHTNNHSRNHTRVRSFDSAARRHVMVDIGRSRRKPSQPTPFWTFVWQADTTKAHSNNRKLNHPKSRRSEKPSRGIGKKSFAIDRIAAVCPAAPILHTLSIFEREWGEDSFSAYGFNLIMVAGKNAMSSSMTL